jgi:hypothetical protein
MGKTYKHGERWKKDRRDRNFRKSKKFKDQKGPQHNHKPDVVESQEEENHDISGDISAI